MTKRDYAILGCRILALYLFAQAALTLGAIVAFHGFAGSAAWLLLPLLVTILGLVIWTMAPFLGGKMVRPMGDVDLPPAVSSGGISREGAMEVALVVLGVYLMAMALIEISAYAYEVSLTVGLQQYPPPVALIGHLVQLVIGICLVVGTRSLVSFVSRSRTAGIKKSE
jgi:hypothetical protein